MEIMLLRKMLTIGVSKRSCSRDMNVQSDCEVIQFIQLSDCLCVLISENQKSVSKCSRFLNHVEIQKDEVNVRISKGFCVSRGGVVNGHTLDICYLLGIFLSGNSMGEVYFSLWNKPLQTRIALSTIPTV